MAERVLRLSRQVAVPLSEIELTAVRSQGPGGQNVNKVASAIQLRFDIRGSSLPDAYKERLLALSDHRITRDGVVVIKAQTHRSQEKNREAALQRLQSLLQRGGRTAPARRPTRPSLAARRKRADRKTTHGRKKALRRPPPRD